MKVTMICTKISFVPRLSPGFLTLAVTVLQATKSWARAWEQGYNKIVHVYNTCKLASLFLSSQECVALVLAPSDDANPTYWYCQLLWSSDALHQQLCHV